MRTLRSRDVSEESTFELNIVPMMDMLVSIIPFLLLSAVFMQVMLIDVPLPAPVAQALKEDREGAHKEISIQVNMDARSGFSIHVKDEGGRTTQYAVARSGNDYDYKMLHKKLIEIKQHFPKVFRIELNPDPQVDYKSIVQVMDAARNVENADPKIMIENAATPLLFPDVVLANLMS